MRQWVHFGHKGHYFEKYKFHQIPKTLQERQNKRHSRKEAIQKHKAQEA
jgi:hypothetical protein